MGLDLGSLRTVVRITDDEDWENNWKVYYKPLEIGDRLLVRPSWEKAEDTGPHSPVPRSRYGIRHRQPSHHAHVP